MYIDDRDVTTCSDCGGEVEDFMIETYEVFVDQDGEEYLCADCLHDITGE